MSRDLMKNRQLIFLFLLCGLPLLSIGQDSTYARSTLNTLCSPEMHGRGYVLNGHQLAADFVANEFQSMGAQHFGNNYFQPLSFSINTFPGALALSADGTALKAGEEFIAMGHSGSINGTFDVVYIDAAVAADKKKIRSLIHAGLSDKILVVDARGATDNAVKDFLHSLHYNSLRAAGVIVLEAKLTASMSQEAARYPALAVLETAWPEKKVKRVTIQVDNVFVPKVTSNNVIGFVPGTEKPDSFLVFTAHYDHLGHMGADQYMPGANDNASGTVMLLNLAKHYSQHPHRYSTVFFATTGEEVGLLGSTHFAKNPLFELGNIRFLLNFDILGTGEEGIKVVNATIFKDQFERLKALNKAGELLPAVQPRGSMNRSDHAPFFEREVACFYIYTLGGIAAYHDVFDRPETLPLNEYNDLFRLVTRFMDGF